MPAWQPSYFPEIVFPIRNSGTDECILTRITLEVLSITEVGSGSQSSEQPAETRRDLCYAIILDPDNPGAPHSFDLSVPIPPGETLDLRVVVGAKRSLQTRFVLQLEYDRRRKTRSAEVVLDIDNDGKFENSYHPGIALERFELLDAKSPRDIGIPTEIKPTEIIRSLYLQNRPLNLDYLRTYGPGSAYFFSADKGPLLPKPAGTPIQLEHSPNPTFYVAVGPAYAVRHLSRTEALNLAHDPRLSPPTAGQMSPPSLYGLNDYGACSVADVPDGFAITQVLPGCGLTGINTEIFTEGSAERLIGAVRRNGLDLIPWGEVHQLAINTVNRYIQVLREFCNLHGPIFVRAGLVNVEGRTLAEITDNVLFEGQVLARGPLRRENHVTIEFLEYPDPYESGVHVLGRWAELIAADAMAGRMPSVFPRE